MLRNVVLGAGLTYDVTADGEAVEKIKGLPPLTLARFTADHAYHVSAAW